MYLNFVCLSYVLMFTSAMFAHLSFVRERVLPLLSSSGCQLMSQKYPVQFEICSLSLGVKNRLTVHENTALSRIFDPKTNKVTG